MSDPSPAVVARIKIASDYTAALIGLIGWLGGVASYFLVGFSPWWSAAAFAIAYVSALFSIRVCRAHSFRVAAICTSQARDW